MTVNGQTAGPDTVIKNGQVIAHTLHRHEPPVTANEIGIIHEDDDMLVIDKPAGVPVHSAGRYHYNSVVEILRAQRSPSFVPRPCNRLDRLTSGVMFIGKHPKGADTMAKNLLARSVQKEYVARVKGKFPDGVVVCDQPVMQVSPKLGLNRVRATGKDAKTKFRRMAYYPPSPPPAAAAAAAPANGGEDEDDNRAAATPPPALSNEEEGYSIVHCFPLTGRTHQIRVHLQFLGYPITNDPIYSNRRVFGPNLGKHETTADRDTEIIEQLSRMGKTELPDTVYSYRTHLTAAPDVPPGTDPAVVNQIMTREHEEASIRYHKRKGEMLSGQVCEICGTELYSDPGVHELGIFLHAVAYADRAGDWHYRSGMPSWALPPGGCPGPTSVPDWVDDEASEVVIGHGVVPEGLDESGGKRGQGHSTKEMTLIRGVGMVDVARDGLPET